MTTTHFRRTSDLRGRPCPKIPYDTQEAALLGLLQAGIHRIQQGKAVPPGRAGHEAGAYKCPKCGQWHLTSLLPDDVQPDIRQKALVPISFVSLFAGDHALTRKNWSKRVSDHEKSVALDRQKRDRREANRDQADRQRERGNRKHRIRADRERKP